MQHCSGRRKNEGPLAGVGGWIQDRRLRIGRQHRRAHDRSWWRRNDVSCSAIGTPNWLPNEIDHWMHGGVASGAFEGGGLWWGCDQLAWKGLLVGVPQFVLLAFERGWHV